MPEEKNDQQSADQSDQAGMAAQQTTTVADCQRDYQQANTDGRHA